MPRPLRICLVTQEFPPYTNWGGVGVRFDNFAQAASALGHSVTVISRCEAGAPGYERQPGGVEVHRVGANMRRRMLTGRTFDRILHARTVLAKLAALDTAQPFDVVETLLSVAFFKRAAGGLFASSRPAAENLRE